MNTMENLWKNGGKIMENRGRTRIIWKTCGKTVENCGLTMEEHE